MLAVAATGSNILVTDCTAFSTYPHYGYSCGKMTNGVPSGWAPQDSWHTVSSKWLAFDFGGVPYTVSRIVVKGTAFSQNRCFLRKLQFVFGDGSNQTMDACTDDYTVAPIGSLLAYDLVPVITSWVRVNLIVNEVDGSTWQSWDSVSMSDVEFYGSLEQIRTGGTVVNFNSAGIWEKHTNQHFEPGCSYPAIGAFSAYFDVPI